MEGCLCFFPLAANLEAVSALESTGLLVIKPVGLIKTATLPPLLQLCLGLYVTSLHVAAPFTPSPSSVMAGCPCSALGGQAPRDGLGFLPHGSILEGCAGAWSGPRWPEGCHCSHRRGKQER